MISVAPQGNTIETKLYRFLNLHDVFSCCMKCFTCHPRAYDILQNVLVYAAVIQMRTSTGPETDPCGTPYLRVGATDKDMLYSIFKV